MKKLLGILALVLLVGMTFILTGRVSAANNWSVGNIVGLCQGTRIYYGSGYSYGWHTESPFDGWGVKIMGGPRYADGRTWWDTSRYAVDGQPWSGTGWIPQEDAGNCPWSEGGSGGDGSGGGDGGSGGGTNWCASRQLISLAVEPDIIRIQSSFNPPYPSLIQQASRFTAALGGTYCDPAILVGPTGNSDWFLETSPQYPGVSTKVEFLDDLSLTGYGVTFERGPLLNPTWGIDTSSAEPPYGPAVYVGLRHEDEASNDVVSLTSSYETLLLARSRNIDQRDLAYAYAYYTVRAAQMWAALKSMAEAAAEATPAVLLAIGAAILLFVRIMQPVLLSDGAPGQAHANVSWTQPVALYDAAYVEAAPLYGPTEFSYATVPPSDDVAALLGAHYGELTDYATLGSLYPSRSLISAYTEFTFEGDGFTPDSEVYVEFGLPGEEPVVLTVVRADPLGHIEGPIVMPPPQDVPLGTYLLSAVDYAALDYWLSRLEAGEVAEPIVLIGGAAIEVVEDVTPPDVTVSSPLPQEYTRCDAPNIEFGATDDLSGIASVTALLDGTQVTDGMMLDFLFWDLGGHILSVDAVDKVGWQTRDEVTFELHATIEGTRCALQQFFEIGLIDSRGVYNSLESKLRAAQADLDAGRVRAATNLLNAFLQEIDAQQGRHIAPNAADILYGDVQSVASELGD